LHIKKTSELVKSLVNPKKNLISLQTDREPIWNWSK